MAFRRIELPITWVEETEGERLHRQRRLAQIDSLLTAIEEWNHACTDCEPEPAIADDLLLRYRRVRRVMEREYGADWSVHDLNTRRLWRGSQLHEALLELQIPLMRRPTGPEFAIGSYVVRELPSAPAGSDRTQAG